MKLLKKNFKSKTKIKIESLDDMWNILQIIKENDIISAKTLRTLQTSNEKEKKLIYLSINTEKIEFNEDSQTLRFSGKIINGPEDINHGYHTITIKINDTFDVEKKWKQYEINRLNKTINSKKLEILAILTDEHSTKFYTITENKITELGESNGEGNCKIYSQTNNNKYYENIKKAIEEYSKRFEHIIIAGPGFTKDNILKLIKDEKIRKKIITEGCSTTNLPGINEIIKRGAIDRIITDTFLSKETEQVELFLNELSKDTGLASYGYKEINEAIKNSAIETLLISDKLIRDKKIQDIIEFAEKSNTKIHIINSNHDAGKQLYNLGGIAGILRYKIK
jgi:protein pelota